MESMKRVEVLKSIQNILVEKAYETGHISHRADGDWQKQDDGSWLPVKGNEASAPAKETPTTQTADQKLSQDWDSLSKEDQDKWFDKALQYQREWAEDSDEEVRQMAEDTDVSDIARMLFANREDDEPQPDQDNSPERAEYERQLSEEQARRAEEDPRGYGYEEPPAEVDVDKPAEDYSRFMGKSSEWTQNRLSDLGYQPTETDKNGRPTEYENDEWDTLYVTYDRLGYVTSIKTDDDFEDDEVDYSDEAYEQDSDARAQMTDKEIINHLWENGDFNDYNSMISDSSYDPEEGYFTDDDELSDMADQFMEDHGIEYSDDAWNAIRNKFMAQAEKIFKSTKQIDIHAPSVKNMGF